MKVLNATARSSRMFAAAITMCFAVLAAGAPPTPQEALTTLLKGDKLSEPQLAEIRSAIETAATAEPKEDDWQLGLAILARATGDRKKAADFASIAVKLDPKSARNWYWKGTTQFEGVADAGTLDKMSIASDGKEAYLKAVELDPKLIEPRIGLAQFYIHAPGLAGGSYRKAREQGRAIMEIENGAFWGHLVLAMVAQDDEDWKEMSKEYAAAVDAATSDDQRVQGLLAHAGALVNDRKKYDDALPLLEKARAISGAENATVHFMLGEAMKGRKEWSPAIAEYRRVLELNPNARSTRYSLAECLEKTGDLAGAKAMYEEFVAKFPKDDRAEEATDRAHKLGRKLK